METKEKPAPKEKRRNNEKRKEKSRNAARSRRSQESVYFNDLAEALPVLPEFTAQLDKASIMRMAIAYLQTRELATLVEKQRKLSVMKSKSELETNEAVEDNKIGQMVTDRMYLRTLDGFVVGMKPDGTFAFVSENVQDFLGIQFLDVVGLTIYELVHPVECNDIKALLEPKDEKEPKSIIVRMKCTLTSKGRTVNFKSASYKNIRITGHMVVDAPDADREKSKENEVSKEAKCFVAYCRPIPHPANIEAPLPCRTTFMTKHDANFKIIQADCKNMTEVLGYKEEDLLGKSIYEFIHISDYSVFTEGAKHIKDIGQYEYDPYRFIAKNGGWVWVTTQATALPEGKKTQEPPKYSSIVCVNYIISGVENPDLILSLSQLESVEPKSLCIPEDRSVATSDTNNSCNSKTTPPPPLQPPVIVAEKVAAAKPLLKEVKAKKPLLPEPQTVTADIFADKTQEMETPFMFTEEKSSFTMFKDDPDDLTHLAPVAGDVSVPLDEPIFNGMGLLSTDFDKLLGGDDPTDPFISYRSSYDTSPQLLSPNLSKNSESSLPSLSSPSDSLSDEDRISTFMSLQLDEDTEPILAKPFMLDSAENMSYLMAAGSDLMWNSNERSKNSPESPHLRAHLLTTSHVNSINNHSKSNDHGGGLLQTDLTLKRSYKIEKGTMNKHMSRMKQTPLKRFNSPSFDELPAGKRRKFEQKFEQKEKMSPELLQQLMSANPNRGLPKGKSNWLLDTGGHKAACLRVQKLRQKVIGSILKQDDPMMGQPMKREDDSSGPPSPVEDTIQDRESMIRKNSLSLLDPDATAIPSSYLTQQDFEVNAPVSSVLYGTELLTALELNAPPM